MPKYCITRDNDDNESLAGLAFAMQDWSSARSRL